jgi:hypothetical protein
MTIAVSLVLVAACGGGSGGDGPVGTASLRLKAFDVGSHDAVRLDLFEFVRFRVTFRPAPGNPLRLCASA